MDLLAERADHTNPRERLADPTIDNLHVLAHRAVSVVQLGVELLQRQPFATAVMLVREADTGY